MLKTLPNAALFQCGWFACVLGGDSLWLLVGLAVLAVHLLWISAWAKDGVLIISVMLVGTAVDTLLRAVGVFQFSEPGPLIPFCYGHCWRPPCAIAWPGARGRGGVPHCWVRWAGRCPTTRGAN